MKKLAVALGALAMAAVAGAASAEVNVWSNNFDGGAYFQNTGPFPVSVLSFSFGGGGFAPSQSFPGFGTDYWRNSTTGVTQFQASGLGAHSALHVSFDIAFIDSWDSFGGNCCGPDVLTMNVDGAPTEQLTWNGGGGFGPVFGTGTLVGTGSFGVNGAWQDAVVHYDFLVAHSASSWQMSINAGGAGWQGGDDESWGIDNFHLGAVPTRGVPEPATWALMIGGFGLAGAALRRRRAVVA